MRLHRATLHPLRQVEPAVSGDKACPSPLGDIISKLIEQLSRCYGRNALFIAGTRSLKSGQPRQHCGNSTAERR